MELFAMLLMLGLFFPRFAHPAQTVSFSSPQTKIPTVDCCEMRQHPELYFDRTVRITATFLWGQEGSDLIDVRCVQHFGDQIGVDAVAWGKQPGSLQPDFDRLLSGRFGYQPRVTVTGILRNISKRATEGETAPSRSFHTYRYLFVISGLEKMGRDPTQEIVSYNRTLRQGFIYNARVRADSEFGLAFELPLRIAAHQAVRLEWANLNQFPELQGMSTVDRRVVVLRVVSDEVRQMTPQRWNRNVTLEILLVESSKTVSSPREGT